MKKNMRRAWAWVMILCMVLSMVPAAAVPGRAEETAPTVNGEYTGGEWAQGGTGTVSYDVDGTQVTLSKTAQAVEGMENTYDITLSVRTSTSTSLKTNAGAVVLVIDRSNSMKYCAECGGNGRHDGLSGKGWTVTDPMTPYIDVTGGTGDSFYKDGSAYTWELRNVRTETEGNTTYYIYTYTYRVTFDPQFEGFVEGEYYPTNEETYLNIEGKQYEFPVPGVQGKLPRRDVTVTKVWNDEGNQDGIRPNDITVKLLADGEDTGNTLVLSQGNGWTGSFTELNVNRAGQKITYTVEEISVEGYTTDITGSQSQGFTITNTHETETVDIMKNDTMFGTLSEYDRQSYYEAHKTIWLLTPEECLRLEPIAGFVTRADSDSYTIFETVEELREYLTSAVSQSGFESDADIEQIERIVTLSTCTYQGVDKRYILVCGIREPQE